MKTVIALSSLLFERHPKQAQNLTDIFDNHNIEYQLIENTKDIWARDYMPFVLDDGISVSYKYTPGYLVNYPDIRTDFSKKGDRILDLVIDGGNFVRYKNQAIMTDKVFLENSNFPKEQIIATIKQVCNLERLVIIPKQPYDIYGHSDSMVRWIDKSTVLVNDFSIESLTFRTKLKKSLLKYGLKIHELKYSKGFLEKHNKWGAYLNFLKVANVLIVPVYKEEEDATVLKQLSNIFADCIIEPIELNPIINEGGALHCISAQMNISK